jgi:hypothetical protein
MGNDNLEPQSQSLITVTEPPCRRWRLGVVSLFIVAASAIGMFLWNRSAPEKPGQQIVQSQPIDADARYRKLVLGTWEDEYQGKRTMTLNKDGTGTMVVELSGWRAALAASRLKFNMKWSVESGHLKKQTISGEPETQVKMILKTMGDCVDEPILELTEDRLLLLDQDGKTKYDWRRVSKSVTQLKP